jgi:hypothetical protein
MKNNSSATFISWAEFPRFTLEANNFNTRGMTGYGVIHREVHPALKTKTYAHENFIVCMDGSADLDEP